MATVVLTAVGTILGGPLGGAIGAALGQRVDGAILGSKPREGPRIKELDVQTSSYGTQIPAIFGAMRVAGTVIWSTDLIERKVKSGGGKGRSSTVNYSYSVSFAVALSSRPLARVGRIWADGNLLRGAAGDFKTETEFRFHAGHADQPLDPLLASAEASGFCPAHRDLAYVVFEDFQLADYGNRIPSLTFEIFERETHIPCIDIAKTISGGLVAGSSSPVLSGYAVQGQDVRSALQPLMTALPISIWPDKDQLVVSDWSAHTNPLMLDDPVVRLGAGSLDRPKRIREASGRASSSLSIRHYDPDRDFQAGVQVSRMIGNARRDTQIEFAAAMDAASARRFADVQLMQQWRGLNGFEGSIAEGAEPVSIGSHLQIEDASEPFRIIEVEHQRGVTKVTGQEWMTASVSTLFADPGRNQPDQDMVVGETRLILADLPATNSDDPGKPIIVAAVAGSGAGWRRAALSRIDADRETDLGGSTGIATMGTLLGPLLPHSDLLLDQQHQPVIRLLHDRMTLPPGSGDPLSNDAPALWINDEIIRYGTAEKIAARDYRLKDLVRGCFNSGSAVTHSDGANCFLLDADGLVKIDVGLDALGSAISINASGVGDSQPVNRLLAITGQAVRPRSPVHGRIEKRTNGDLYLSWIRRDRLTLPWGDAVDILNSEAVLEFVIAVAVAGQTIKSWTINASDLQITGAELSMLNIPSGALLDFSISQQGRYARSDPLILSILF
jgi:hypothetical protein